MAEENQIQPETPKESTEPLAQSAEESPANPAIPPVDTSPVRESTTPEVTAQAEPLKPSKPVTPEEVQSSSPSEPVKPSEPTPSMPSSGERNVIFSLLQKARQKIQERKQKKLEKVLNLIQQKGRATNSEIRKLLRTSDATVTRYMDELEKQGKVRQLGSRKASYYELVR